MYSSLKLQELIDENGHKITPLAKVCLIYTGGTIGMIPKNEEISDEALRPASLDELLSSIPNVGKKEGIQLGMVSFDDPVDSSDITAKDWITIGTIIEENYSRFDGFVILHGTDTMAFTASGLSFLLKNLDKPVIITGSQLPIKHPRTDAIQNLISSIYLAGYKAVKLPKIPEVVICFADLILRGNRVTKMSASTWKGFESPNFPPLGSIGEYINVRKDLILENRNKGTFFTERNIADEIRIVLIHPGLTPNQLSSSLDGEYNGAILLTYGAGNMPTSQEYYEIVKNNVEEGKTILSITQCEVGTVEMGLYEASSGLLEAGATSGLDMTLEAALTKMYWVLSRFKGYEAHKQMQIAEAGEQSYSLLDMYFKIRSNHKGSASDRIVTDNKTLAHYQGHTLEKAIMRIQDLGFEIIDNTQPASVRVFINEPNATANTSIVNYPYFIEEFNALKVKEENSNIIYNFSKTASNNAVVREGQTQITLVGINAKIYCKSIYLSFYVEAK